MNIPTQPDPSQKTHSKLFVRSEVLAVIRHLQNQVDPPKHERAKQIKRLKQLEHRDYVQDVLVKELRRSASPSALAIVTELLMELGEIDYLRDTLWEMIRDPKVSDDIKDVTNLVLRHLGDSTDPELYLEYLQDPQALIARETSRMLEVSAENPETLIDFIDFILSLGNDDQVRLISSLQRDYPSEHLVNLFVPLLESDPSPELWEQLVDSLAQTKSQKAANSLLWISSWPESVLPVSLKSIQIGLKQLQLAGVTPQAYVDLIKPATEGDEHHPMVQKSEPYRCYATLSDGIGNQGILFSRKRHNGDISMMCVAINDMHGVLDCFGFFELTESDFHRIADKFHEGSTKIVVTPEYCAEKLRQAQLCNMTESLRLPYEYHCWAPLISDMGPSDIQLHEVYETWVRSEWLGETYNLFQHPDFNSWFLEQGDEDAVTPWLKASVNVVEDYMQALPDANEAALFEDLDAMAIHLMKDLFQTQWKALFIKRLQEASFLLDCQNTQTFRSLAATEAHKLVHATSPEEMITGFSLSYGRRCVLEELLRYRTGCPEYDTLSPIVDRLIEHWGF